MSAGEATGHLLRVTLEEDGLGRLPAALAADRAQAVADLEAEGVFALTVAPGPYCLVLAIRHGRLVFEIDSAAGERLHTLGLALGPFRSLVKDYRMLVESHMLAIEEGREARIQAIDMGRRGLHDEGARLMIARLDGRIAVDFATARRLFTLVCALHPRP